MASTIPSVWPDDISVDVVSPMAILNAQKSALAEKTKNLVVADIVTSEKDGMVWHRFDLVAPSLSGYRREIFSVGHTKDEVWPATLDAEHFSEFRENYRDIEVDGRPQTDGPDGLLRLLAELFQSPSIRTSLDSLIARVNDGRSQPPNSGVSKPTSKSS